MKNEINKHNYKITISENLHSSNETREPSLFQIFLHNDDFTPMEFVVDVLEKFFYMDRQKAASVMMEAHMKGSAMCGVFSKDFAESKVSQIMEHARMNEHPLNCSMENV